MRKTSHKESTLPEILCSPKVPIITVGRTLALSNVNRWGGWTIRPFSVLEHSVIGALVLKQAAPQHALGFLLHDYEESEFGDVITPNKRIYMNTKYDIAVEVFNNHMCAQVGISYRALGANRVRQMDDEMAWAERDTIATRGDSKYDNGREVTVTKLHAVDLIESRLYSSRGAQVAKFWELYSELTRINHASGTSTSH